MRAKLLPMQQRGSHSSPSRIITLDGPAGTGKSTVARLLARRLGVDFLDTGAMYRGLTAACLDQGIAPTDQARVQALAESLRMQFDWTQDPPRLHVNGVDVSERIRDRDVTAAVSEVAANPAVRRLMVRWQRQIGQAHPKLVTEGRDQGSVVFPEALVKFYLAASAEVRAERRTRQLLEAEKPAHFDDILRDIQQRDERDTTRADSPLVRPEGAILVDTSAMTLEQVVDHLHQQVIQAMNAGPAARDKGTDSHV